MAGPRVFQDMRLSLPLLAAAALVAAAPAAAHAQQKAPALSAQPQAIPLDRVVAVVGDVVITQSNLQEKLIAKRQEGAKIPTDSTAFRAFVLGAANELVDEELLLRKGKELKVEVPDADIANTVDKQIKEIRGRFTSEAEYRNELAKAGLGTPEEFKRYRLDEVKRSETISRTVRKLREEGKIVQANVTDAEVEDAYERNKSTLPKREASIAWRQIIVAPRPSPAAKERARAKAESLLVELKTGGDFEKLAKRESMDPGSKDNGGDLGWNRRGRMVAEFDRWMFALPPGQLSPVIETPFGYHIIRVDRVWRPHGRPGPRSTPSPRSTTTSRAPRRPRCSHPSRVRSFLPRISRASRTRRRRSTWCSRSRGMARCRPSSSSRRSRRSRKAGTSPSRR
jgi:peptidyl-prolyl cis-trans isomerase SurA